MLAFKIVLVIVVVLILAVVGLRARKLRGDEQRDRFQKLDRRLVSPPPSPYRTSKGFRLLDGTPDELMRPAPPRPRLEPDQRYVFSDSQLAPPEEHAQAQARRDAQWALDRAGRRSRSMGSMTLVVVAVLVVVATVGVGYALRHKSSKVPVSATTTSTTTLATTTTWPAVFTPSATSGTSATYAVPSASYAVTVTGVAGAVWTVYEMGPHNTLEYQASVKPGTSKTLVMTGVSRVTLGSPRNAAVKVGGSPVTFPTPLTSPLVLVFRPLSG